MRIHYGYGISLFGAVAAMTVWLSEAKPYSKKFNISSFNSYLASNILPDSLMEDTTTEAYKATRRTTYQPKDRPGDPITHSISPSPLLLKDPASLKLDVEIDTGMNYTIYEKIGDINYRPTTTMSFEEFSAYEDKKMIKEYWKDKAAGLDGESALSSRQLVPTLYFSPIFDRIFGGSYVNIEPTGFVTLDFGMTFPRTLNPALTIRQQRGGGGFKFDMQTSFNVVGKVGEKLSVAANFDNNNSFDFENNMKVEFTGFDEDIIKKIEIGNVSLPANNSLINGGQNLFGVKTQLQFGKLYVTSILTNQRGKADVLTLEGGSQLRDFEVRASDYDENRHFFLSHYFRDNYEKWLKNSPQITSGVTVNRVEIYVINRSQDTETLRSIVGLMDLGEADSIYRDKARFKIDAKKGKPSSNNASKLYEEILSQIDKSNDVVGGELEQKFGYQKSTDYEINVARKLEEGTEYVINKQLGYISLLRKLQNDDLLAVAFEYSVNGETFRVGELTEDYQSRPADEVAFLKLLRPNNVNPRVPTWKLMMRNIYPLNATQLAKEDFQLRIIYRDDKFGVDNPSLHEGEQTKNKALLQLFNMDKLNPNNDPQPDGNFDFIEGLTIDTKNGNIIFPVLEPFGKTLESYFNPVTERSFINKYVFKELYSGTKADAELNASKNKFFIKGKLQAGSSSEIILPGIGISEGSVIVMAGNTRLTEGVDYTVDYQLGRVVIINEGILSSGRKINIAFEKADLFSFQQRSLMGTRFDYKLSDKVNFGATYLRYNERPNVSRNSIGAEPMRNILWGFDLNYSTDARFLTKMMDALPIVETKEMSTITFSGEFAQLKPGTSNYVDGEGTSYIDAFEDAAPSSNLIGTPTATWKLASTPQTFNNKFDKTAERGTLGLNYKRAKIAWYTIDNVFYYGGNNKPENIAEEDLYNHYVRPVVPQEIYQRDKEQVNTNLGVFDIAYYPEERGPYNYNDIEINPTNALLTKPTENWGGITRAITSDVDFDKTNVEYIEFWMMDPFINSEFGKIEDGNPNPKPNTTGGFLYMNLGNVSEDLMKDKRHAFENGLPPNGDPTQALENEWGRVTTQTYLNNAFDNSTGARANQDVGLDGINSDTEATFFGAFTSNVPAAIKDPSADDFHYFLGSDLDNEDMGVLERYKNYNGMEGNSPLVVNNNLNYSPSGSINPDNEDLNGDNIISDLESYYEYKMELRPGNLNIGSNYIVDKLTTGAVTGSNEQVDWYLFRIPVKKVSQDSKFGDIEGFKTIRFLRTYLTGFAEPVVLRFAKFQLVSSQWRKYEGGLYNNTIFGEVNEGKFQDPNFTVSVVGFEENGAAGPNKVAYSLPPGINRDRDNTSAVQRKVNEQSLQLCVDDLNYKDARAVYKNTTLDLVNYGRIKMFLHAQSSNTQDGEISGIYRMGTDFDENYYEIEIPLKITPYGTTNPSITWPEENEIDLDINELYDLKAKRLVSRGPRNDALISQPFSMMSISGQYKLTIRGRPDLSAVKVLMIGVRNPEGTTNAPKSVCIWANELRVTDFKQQPGWAANATLNTKLADIANVTASTRYTSVGFGSIQQKIAERTRNEAKDLDISANVTLDKFLPPILGLKIPMYVGYQTSVVTPFFDPRDPDIPLASTLKAFNSSEERDDYLLVVQDRSTRRSINFTNLRKVKTNTEAKSHIYDVENLSFTYAFSEQLSSNFATQSYVLRNYKGAVAYNFTAKDFSIEPFKKSKGLKSPYLKLIKDVNFSPYPSTLGFRYDLDRRFVKTQYRNADLSTTGFDPLYEKAFTFNRGYNFRWAITKGIAVDYNSSVYAIIDEPDGDIITEAQKTIVKDNLKNLGRMKTFQQTLGANYRLPFDKIPFTDWFSSDLRYSVGYNWNAGAYNKIDSLDQQRLFGNTIQNNRERALNGKVDMVKLYNKVKLLKDVNTPPRKGKADTLWIHQPRAKFAKNTLKFLMSLKSVNFTYGIREGTLLPGFNKTPFLFGADSSFAAPGFPFILGSQDPNIRFAARDNNWLAYGTEQTTPFSQNRSIDFTYRASIEPLADLKIQLDGKKNQAANYTEIYRFDDQDLDFDSVRNEFVSINQARTGNYTISTLMIRTAFNKTNSNDQSEVFSEFEQNLFTMRARLVDRDNGLNYDTTSQDVVIPAFIAAYTGNDALTASLSPIPRIPLPNWRVDYAGLSKIKALQEVFTSINITHGYTSTYTIGNYTRSADFKQSTDLKNDIENYPTSYENSEGVVSPVYIIGQVTMSEQFSPLIGINVRTKSKITAKIEYKRDRSVSMNLSNVQIQEMQNKDWVLDVGYTKSNLKLPFRSKGRIITLKNEVTMRCNFTVRDTQTIQRQIGELGKVTTGNVNLQLRPTVSYMLNKRLNLQMYFERTLNEPKVSTSFTRKNTAAGVQLRFNLAE